MKRRKYGDLSELSWLLKHDGTIRPDSGSASRLQAQVQPVQVLTYQVQPPNTGSLCFVFCINKGQAACVRLYSLLLMW